jgi:hypothetical protein
MDKLLSETKVTERFQERDLSTKVGTDSESLVGPSQRLGHSDTAITQRVYPRKSVVIEPLKKGRET